MYSYTSLASNGYFKQVSAIENGIVIFLNLVKTAK